MSCTFHVILSRSNMGLNICVKMLYNPMNQLRQRQLKDQLLHMLTGMEDSRPANLTLCIVFCVNLVLSPKMLKPFVQTSIDRENTCAPHRLLVVCVDVLVCSNR